VPIPPLRDRLEDIPDLIMHFCHELCCDVLDWTVWEPTQDHDWPGNVRELRGFVDQVVAFYGEHEIKREDVVVALRDHCLRVPRVHLSPSGKPKTAVCPDLERLQPYMAKLGFSSDPSNEPVASLAAYLSRLSQEQRQRFLGEGCRIPQDSILLTIVADAIALACLEQADQRKTAPVIVAVDDFGMHRMREKRRTDLAALERAVYDRLKR
jgi:DNA-binding NtrC family response regulator